MKNPFCVVVVVVVVVVVDAAVVVVAIIRPNHLTWDAPGNTVNHFYS